MRARLRRVIPVILTATWASAVVSGLGLLWTYGATPGADGHPPQRWPYRTSVKPSAGRANLVMAVHPRCPCTRATIAELARLMAASDGRVEAHVLFLAPGSMPGGWERSALWASAALIPGVHPIRDPGGDESARFGLETSGHVLIYDAEGHLRFSGGITATRGHEGDNAGLDAAIRAVSGDTGAAAHHPVFGCPIVERAGTLTTEERQ